MMTPLIATAMVSALATGTALTETPRLTTADAAQAVVLSPGTAAPASAVDNGAAAVSQAANVTTTAPHNSAQPVLIRRGENSIQVHLASDFADSQLADGLSTYRSENSASAISVNPAADGDTQFLVAVGARSAPTKYAFDFSLPTGGRLAPRPDGGIDVREADGGVVAAIAPPWAHDAHGLPVSTHYVIAGSTLTQVIEHKAIAVTYPVIADPSVKLCDFYTHVCLKLSKSETKSVKSAVFVSLGAGIGTLCGLIPWLPPYMALIKAACAALVAAYFYALKSTFESAVRQGRCVELKFDYLAHAALIGWKVLDC